MNKFNRGVFSSVFIVVAWIGLMRSPGSLHAASELDQIREDFDTLSESLTALKGQTSSINQEITSFSGYLNALVSDPVAVVGKEIDGLQERALNLSDEEWDDLMKADSAELIDLLATNASVRQNLDQITSGSETATTALENLETKVDSIQDNTTRLVERIVDYTDGKPFRAVRLLSLTSRIKSLSSDAGEVARAVPDSLQQTATVVQRVNSINALQPSKTPTGEPGGSSSPAPAPAGTTEEQSASVQFAAPSAKTATSDDDPFTGSWREVDASGTPASLLLASGDIGSPAGFVVDASRNLQTSLVLKEKSAERQIYTDPASGNLFSASPFEEQLILKHYQPDGTRIFQIFMERP